MTDKERLEEIKQDVKMTRKDLVVSPSNEMTLHMNIMLDSMDYLIERVQELEGINERLLEAFDTKMRVHDSLLKDYATLKVRAQESKELYEEMLAEATILNNQNKCYREVLKFYALGRHWITSLKDGRDYVNEYGELAEKALKECEGGDWK